MTKKKRKKIIRNAPNTSTSKDIEKKNYAKWIWFILITTLAIGIVILISNYNQPQSTENKTHKKFEPKFKTEGELTFFKESTSLPISNISIEIADNEYERMLGLMYRRSMADTLGMLFIMEREEPQSFWMRNTYLSLDIVYLDSDLKIVKIQKYTEPFSEDPVPSIHSSKYVVEVVAGYCDKYGISEGDHISYIRSK